VVQHVVNRWGSTLMALGIAPVNTSPVERLNTAPILGLPPCVDNVLTAYSTRNSATVLGLRQVLSVDKKKSRQVGGEMVTKKSMNDWLARLETGETAVTPDSAASEGAAQSATVVSVAEPAHPSAEVVTVAYQKIFYDWAIADGTYAPQQLRKAKVAVKAWGPVLTYPLTVERDSAC